MLVKGIVPTEQVIDILCDAGQDRERFLSRA